MKRCISYILILVCVLGLAGCNDQTMDDIIENEPNITGIVEEVRDNYILINIKRESYPEGASCKVSLDVENKDSYASVSVGDEIIVYYNGEIAESDPLEINTVYAITLETPVDRDIME